jgi:hypothetical protein
MMFIKIGGMDNEKIIKSTILLFFLIFFIIELIEIPASPHAIVFTDNFRHTTITPTESKLSASLLALVESVKLRLYGAVLGAIIF